MFWCGKGRTSIINLPVSFLAWQQCKTSIGSENDNFDNKSSENESVFEGNNGSETSTTSQYNTLDMENSLITHSIWKIVS